MLTIWEFGANWCGACKILEPIVADVVKEHHDVILKKVDVDNDENDYCTTYGVRNLPTLIFDGADKDFSQRVVGTTTKDNINSIIDKYNNIL